MAKMPAPPKRAPDGVPAVVESKATGDVTRGVLRPAPPIAPVHSATSIGPVRLIISAEITIPAAPGYARRLTNLILDLKRAIEEQAPWLRKVEIEVER